IKEGHFDWPVGGDIKLVAYFYRDAARLLAETPLSEDQVLEPCEDDEDWFELQATAHDTMQLRRWLVERGGEVILEPPKNLRQEITGIAESNLTNYQSN